MKGDRHTMKSLILTTQDARELDKLGGLTITKPIKPAPRYIEGASFSREADCADIWHLVGQDGNRLGAGDGVADVFASPVEVSDVVFIREPWYRLKNPQGGESERVILAADSVVQPEQAAYILCRTHGGRRKPGRRYLDPLGQRRRELDRVLELVELYHSRTGRPNAPQPGIGEI